MWSMANYETGGADSRILSWLLEGADKEEGLVNGLSNIDVQMTSMGWSRRKGEFN